MTITWISPAAGQLATFLELDEGTPVFSTTFVVDTTNGVPMAPQTEVHFELIDGRIPEYYTLTNNGDNTATLEITPLVRELDQYIPEYIRPDDFVYDTGDTAGGKYATYGSALSGGYTFNFTIRANNALSGASDFADRTFTMFVFNNWSSDRDDFMLEYHQDQTLLYNDVEYEPEDFLIAIKGDGYYD